MKVKICGITNLEDALCCEKFGADAIGFIFHKESLRYISHKDAAQISKRLSLFTVKVGVFVNEKSETINQIAETAKLNIVQLHGEENQELIDQINLPVIKGFSVDDNFDFSKLSNFKNVTYLLDSFSKSAYGGTGKQLNINIIPPKLRNFIILAGGISIYNIENIFKVVSPAAVDLSSSLESEPGVKNHKKVQDFLSKINSLRYAC